MDSRAPFAQEVKYLKKAAKDDAVIQVRHVVSCVPPLACDA